MNNATMKDLQREGRMGNKEKGKDGKARCDSTFT